MSHYPYLCSRLFNSPLMIHPGKLHAIVAGLSDRLGVTAPPVAYTTPFGTREKGGYRLLDNGVAVIDVYGVLAHRGGMQADSSYIQGYDGLARNLDTALADPSAAAILLNIDSPGGEVAGAFQLADQVYAARSIKPIAAVAGDMAASAAYLIASAAETVSVAPTGMVGSIGVVTSHVDMSRAVDRMGLTVTYIYAGAHKIDGNPLQPLPEAVAADIQAEIDHFYGMFVFAVANYRNLGQEAIRATEARMFIGSTAAVIGLADYVETPDQAIGRLAARISKSTGRLAGGNNMGIKEFFGRKRLNVDIQVSEADPPDESATEEDAAPTPTPEPSPPEPAALSALAVVQGCNAAGEPRLAEVALKTPHTAEQLQARIRRAKQIRAMCATADMVPLADGLIASDADESTAALQILNALAARSEATPVDSTPPSAKQRMTRADFAALSPIQARDFVRAGGEITE